MKNGIKTLATWLILAIIFIVILNSAVNNTETKMSYSELINNISNGQVTKIRLDSSDNKAYVTMKGADTGNNTNTVRNAEKEVVIPSIEALMEEISDDIAGGELVLVQEEESIFITILSAFSPFIILIIFFFFFFVLMNPNQNVNKTDCLLAIGCRFSDRTTGKLEEFIPNAKVIHIGSNPNGAISQYSDYMVRIPTRTRLYLEDEIDLFDFKIIV